MKEKRMRSAFFVLLSGALWGLMGIFVRYFSALGLSSMSIVSIRVITTALILGIVLLIKDRDLFRIKLKDCWCFLGTGLFSIIFFNFCYFSAMNHTSLSVAAVLLYTEPIMVMLMAALLFREKLGWRSAAACGLAFIGCVFVAGIIGGAETVSPKALIFGLLSAFGYGLYSIFGRYALNKGYAPLTIAFYTFVFASVGSLFFLKNTQVVLMGQFGLWDWCVAVLMGIVVTVLPYVFYTIGLAGVSAGSAAIMASVEPVVATLVSVILFREGINLWGILGILLVLASIVLLNLPQKNKK